MSNLPNKILGFKDQYGFLSNFEGPDVFFEGLWYKKIEHAYQAAKSLDCLVREQFIHPALSAGEAKHLGQKIAIRPDWEDIKLKVMEFLVRQKFLHREYVRDLLATGDAYLEETNYWHDNFWGNCTCPKHENVVGANHLGMLLMDIRKELKGFKVIFDPMYCRK